MEDYKVRLLDEKNQLDDRISKLDHMLSMNAEERGFEFSCPTRLLEAQLDSMKRYSSILEERIRIEIPDNRS